MSQGQKGTNGILPNMTRDQLEANIQRIVERDRVARGLGADEIVTTRQATPEELDAIRGRDAVRPMDRLLAQPIRRPRIAPASSPPEEDLMPVRERVRSPYEPRVAEPGVPAPTFVNRTRDHLVDEQPAAASRPDATAKLVDEPATMPVVVRSALDDLLADGFALAPSRSLLGYQPLLSVSRKGELTLTKAAVALLGRHAFATVLVDVTRRRLAIVGTDRMDGARPVHMSPAGSVRINAQNAMRLFDPPIVTGRYSVSSGGDGVVVIDLAGEPLGRTGRSA